MDKSKVARFMTHGVHLIEAECVNVFLTAHQHNK